MKTFVAFIIIILWGGLAWGQTPADCQKSTPAFVEWNCLTATRMAKGETLDNQKAEKEMKQEMTRIATKYGYTLEFFMQMSNRCAKIDPSSEQALSKGIQQRCGDLLKKAAEEMQKTSEEEEED